MSDEREFKVSGGALKQSKKRSTSTRKNRLQGGDNSGPLMQLAAQSSPVGMTADANAQGLASEFAKQVASITSTSIGPGKIQQFGGKRSQKGGDSMGATVNLSSTRSTTTPDAPQVQAVVSGISPSQPAPVGGASRLVLAPPKRKTRISLKAKKHGGSDSMKEPLLGGGAKSKKVRKIHLGVKGVTMRLAKAKKAKRTAMAAPIGEVRSRLEAAKVIKKGSKAPESMMRTMYADLLITKKGL
jgi:hypothetical protein